MTIKDGDFIKITYTGKLEDGSIFDTTNEEVARVHNIYNQNARYGGDVIIIGANQIIQGLEEDIKQHDAGYEGTVSIPPEKAFGHRNPKLIRDLPLKKFEQQPKVGVQVQIDGKIGTVSKVMGRHARVDFNSPVAGQTITYDYKIVEVIEDTKAKVLGLCALIIGRELDMEIDGTVLKVEVPLELNYFQNWIKAKGQMALDIIKFTELTQVEYIETYTEDMLKPPQEVEEAGEEAGEE